MERAKEKLIGIVVLAFFILSGGCAQLTPSFTFSVEKTPTGNYALQRHGESVVVVENDKLAELSMVAAKATDLKESLATKKGIAGNREVLIYAKIFKNGQFERYVKITDIAQHMTVGQPIVTQNRTFFSEKMDGSFYHIVLKMYEVDTRRLVEALRRVKKTDLDSIETGGFSPGEVFTSGLKDMVFGFFDIVSSLTGRSVADWAAKLGADKIMEHSIYVRSADDLDGTLEQRNYLVVLRNETLKGDGYLVDEKMTNDGQLVALVNGKLGQFEKDVTLDEKVLANRLLTEDPFSKHSSMLIRVHRRTIN